MNIQLFSLRTDAEFIRSDQEKLNNFLQEVVYVKSSECFVETGVGAPYWSVLVHYEACDVKTNGVKIIKERVKEVEESDLTPGGEYVFECLKEWRTEKANALNVPKYLICSNATLINVAYHQPSNLEDLKRIKGFGDKKVQQFGEAIITLLNTV